MYGENDLCNTYDSSVINSLGNRGYTGYDCKECGCVEVLDVVEVGNPCPSIECWTYEEATQSCSMKTECATLSCDATNFGITFSSELFNLDNSGTTFAGGLAPAWDGVDSEWFFNAPLGESGMTYNINTDTNE